MAAKYSQRDIAEALLTLAKGHSSTQTAEWLSIPARTLRHWRQHTYRHAYQHLRETHQLQAAIERDDELADTYADRLNRGIRPGHYATRLAKITERQYERITRLAELDALTRQHEPPH